MSEKALKLLEALKAKKERERVVKEKYTTKAKVKPLTQAERLDRIEELLGLIK